jgi:hypothetical protein
VGTGHWGWTVGWELLAVTARASGWLLSYPEER